MRAALILICLCAVRQSSRFVIIQAPQCLRSRDAAGATAARDCETVRRGASRCELSRSGRWFEAATLAGKPATLAWRRRHRELSAPYSSSRQCIRPASGALPMQCTSVRLLNRYCPDSAWNGAMAAGTAGQHGYPSTACHVVWLAVHCSSNLPRLASLRCSSTMARMGGTVHLLRASNRWRNCM